MRVSKVDFKTGGALKANLIMSRQRLFPLQNSSLQIAADEILMTNYSIRARNIVSLPNFC